MKPQRAGVESLPAILERLIRDRRLFQPAQSILVAVSGGLDSMVLLALLHDLSRRGGWRLWAAHLNHQLRGRSSDADEKLVLGTADRLGLRAIVGRVDVRCLARRQGLSLEMAGRQARHEFLARTAARLGIPSVALAHHGDDQIESFFLRLLRGSGGEGLSGMSWQSPSPADPAVELVRPLLEFPKADLRGYALAHRIRFREDASNANLDIQRNRLRHELLPLLKRRYQPLLSRTITRVMDILGAEAEVVRAAATQWLRRKSGVRFERLPVAVQRRVVLIQLFRLGVNADFDLVERLRLNEHQPTSAPGGLSVQRDHQGTVRKAGRGILSFRQGSLEVDLGGSAGEFTFHGVKFAWKTAPKKGRRLPNPRSSREFFDADRVGTSVCLRHWQPGDRFQPIGMNTPVKLQDLFVNQGISGDCRRELIVAATLQGEVFWVENLRISEQFKLTPGTIRRLQWHWQRP